MESIPQEEEKEKTDRCFDDGTAYEPPFGMSERFAKIIVAFIFILATCMVFVGWWVAHKKGL